MVTPQEVDSSRVSPAICRAFSTVSGVPLTLGHFWEGAHTARRLATRYQILVTGRPSGHPSKGVDNSSIFILYCDKPCRLCIFFCNISRPDRFTQDLGTWKNICRAVGMPDVPLFKHGSIHICGKLRVVPQEVPTPLYTKCMQSQQGAKILYNKCDLHKGAHSQGYGNTAH